MSYTPLNDLQKVAGNPISVNSGPVDNGTIRVVLPTDQPTLNVAVVSGGGSNASVGTTGAAAPGSATEIGLIDVSSGHLVGASSDVRGAKNVLAVEIVDASGNQITSFGSSTVSITGDVEVVQDTAADLLATVSQGTSPWVVSGTVSVGTPTVNQGTSPWVCSIPTDVEVIQDTAADLNATVVFASPQHVIVDSGSSTVSGTVAISTVSGDVEVVQDTAADLLATVNIRDGAGTALTSTGSALDVNIKTSSITIPVSIADAGGVEVVQDTAADLNATVVFASPQHVIVDSGTIAVTQSTSPWVCSIPTDVEVVQDTAADLLATVSQGTSPWVVSLTSTTITGTVSVTQGTSPWVTADQADGTVGGASQPATAIQIGGWDGGHFRAANIDAAGDVQVDVNNTVTVTGNKTHNAAVPTTDNIGALVAVASSGTPTYNNGDQVLLSTDLTGQLRVNASFSGTLSSSVSFSTGGNTLQAVIVNISNATTTDVIAAVGGQTIKVWRMKLFVGQGVSMNVTIKDDTPTTLWPTQKMSGGSTFQFALDGSAWLTTGSGKKLQITTDQATALTGIIYYTQA